MHESVMNGTVTIGTNIEGIEADDFDHAKEIFKAMTKDKPQIEILAETAVSITWKCTNDPAYNSVYGYMIDKHLDIINDWQQQKHYKR